MADTERIIEQHIEVERAGSLDELTQKLADMTDRLLEKGFHLVSISHSHDSDAPPETRHSVLVLARNQPRTRGTDL